MAPATVVVAANNTWTSGSIRIIVPFSDEGPRCGNGEPPNRLDENDACAVVSAGRLVSENQVIVMPVIGDGASGAVLELAEQLAEAGHPQILLRRQIYFEFRIFSYAAGPFEVSSII